MQLEPAPDAAHFVHYEQPDLAADRVRRFFASLPQ
jgi:pimeloyl-ACP methyl ester carboxylesterase